MPSELTRVPCPGAEQRSHTGTLSPSLRIHAQPTLGVRWTSWVFLRGVPRGAEDAGRPGAGHREACTWEALAPAPGAWFVVRYPRLAFQVRLVSHSLKGSRA